MDLASRGKHIIRWIECSGVTANRWWTSCPPPSRPAPRTLVRCEAREDHTFRKKVIFKALMYSPCCMMIGKALLSGFWVRPEPWFSSFDTISHLRSFSLPFSLLSHHFKLLHGVVVASIEVFYDCELLCLDGLLYVISGILAGADP